MLRVLTLFAILFPSAAYGAERAVWQIGKPDHDYSEFACAGDYRASAAKFGAKPVVFEVGRSEPSRDWPFIQPSANDTWSPAAGKPWTIRFSLPESPRGTFTLRVEFTDVHPGAPKYVVSMGSHSSEFQLAPGAGDRSLTNPRPASRKRSSCAFPPPIFAKARTKFN